LIDKLILVTDRCYLQALETEAVNMWQITWHHMMSSPSGCWDDCGCS